MRVFLGLEVDRFTVEVLRRILIVFQCTAVCQTILVIVGKFIKPLVGVDGSPDLAAHFTKGFAMILHCTYRERI